MNRGWRFVFVAGWVALRVVLYLVLGWVYGLLLFARSVLRLLRLIGRAHRALRPVTHCPAGHVVFQYGRFRCTACGGVSDGWVWRCRLCRAFAGFTNCECGLSVRNPLV